eukprot:Em0001g1891a
MSYSKTEGKDKILHVTKDDLAKPEVIDTLLVDTDKYGILLPNGEINWDCPCLGGMPQGPCGQEFKDAFSCFHFSEEDPKGVDCIPSFKAMQECFEKHSELFADYLRDDDGDDESGGGGGGNTREEEDKEGGGGGGTEAAEDSAVDGGGEASRAGDDGTSVDGPEKEGGSVSVEDEHTPMEITPQE